MSFNSATDMIRLVLVCSSNLKIDMVHSYLVPLQNGKFLNVNHVEQNIKDIEVSSSVLRNVYLGRCEINKNEACTAPRGEFTDFNVWLEDLSDVELIEWTTCL